MHRSRHCARRRKQTPLRLSWNPLRQVYQADADEFEEREARLLHRYGLAVLDGGRA